MEHRYEQELEEARRILKQRREAKETADRLAAMQRKIKSSDLNPATVQALLAALPVPEATQANPFYTTVYDPRPLLENVYQHCAPIKDYISLEDFQQAVYPCARGTVVVRSTVISMGRDPNGNAEEIMPSVAVDFLDLVNPNPLTVPARYGSDGINDEWSRDVLREQTVPARREEEILPEHWLVLGSGRWHAIVQQHTFGFLAYRHYCIHRHARNMPIVRKQTMDIWRNGGNGIGICGE